VPQDVLSREIADLLEDALCVSQGEPQQLTIGLEALQLLT
jgi:hypothetical protein